MITARKFARTVEYTVKNSGKPAKTVLVEYPIDPDWTLVEPKEPAEKTRDLYRFAVEAKPGEPAKLAVEEERTDRQQIAIDNLDDNAIRFYLSAKVVSEKVKRRWPRSSSGSTRSSRWRRPQQLEQRIQQIGEDQARIRQNMAQLDRTERRLQELRQEVQRSGGGDREAQRADRRADGPGDRPAKVWTST